MQREIEALLSAYLTDRNKETRMIQELLTALAVGAAARQRMLRDLAAAINGDAARGSESSAESEAGNEITAAIEHLRSVRGPNPSAH